MKKSSTTHRSATTSTEDYKVSDCVCIPDATQPIWNEGCEQHYSLEPLLCTTSCPI